MLGYGSLTGLIVINFLSDYKGRKFSLLIALTSQIVSLICNIPLIEYSLLGPLTSRLLY
jgi:hypothetical protein